MWAEPISQGQGQAQPGRAALVDTHCHLGHLARPLEEALAACERAGVSRVIDVGMGTAESAQALGRASAHPGRVFASVGIHPNDLGELVARPGETLARLRELAAREEVVAVGETGLDLYRERSDLQDQEAAFRAQIDLAKQTRKALVIHCRSAATGGGRAHARVLEILDAQGPPERVVMHCFSADAAYAAACADRGFYCSFAGNLTYPSAVELREAARTVPADLVLVETDAPYLAPVPHRGRPSEPALVAITAATLAEARGVPPPALAAALATNAERAFGLPAP